MDNSCFIVLNLDFEHRETMDVCIITRSSPPEAFLGKGVYKI